MMNLFLANPVAGAWALLGIPAVLAIHFLQTPSRPLPVSTLFLLDRLDPKSTGGRRLERLRQSIPLWLQLLAVLIVAWLLAEPRWLRKDSTQTVLVLLDSSVSMRAFQSPLQHTLQDRLRTLAGSASHTEWLLLETDPAAERLYAGGRLEDLNAALGRWRPRLGTHDFLPALQAGLSLLKGRGLLIFVSDRNVSVPPGVELLAVGHPIENAGFCGIRLTEDGWEAMVTNYGSQPQRRTWHIENEEGKPLGEQSSIVLQPGGSETIRGGFPGGTGKLRVVLNGDDFPLDDVLPLVRPAPKRVRVQVEDAAGMGEWVDSFFRSTSAMDRVNKLPDLRLAISDFQLPVSATPQGPAILFLKEATPQSALVKGMIVAERDPLTDGLTWDGLIVSGTSSIARQPGDAVLLWMGERPLILRRGPQLWVAFDINQSNAPRLPAFVLLLHRFVESVRSVLVAPESANFETNQPVEIAQHGKNATLRAPSEPGFFEAGEEKARLKGAAHFADPREADFHDASSVDHIEAVARAQKERHAEQDAATPAWVLLLGLIMAYNWVKTDGRRAS